MARYKPGTKETTRKRIIEEASRQFREKGVESTSIADVMGALELTVGGFYKHFPSKAALLDEAMGVALTQSAKRLSHATPVQGETDRRGALARMYLTPEHRLNVASGCPIAALCNDIARADEETRRGFQQQLLAYMDTVADGEFADATPERWRTMATLVGGLMIARSVADEDLSDEILDACRAGLSGV